MSNSNNNKKTKKINWTRVLALLLAILMFASVGTLGIMIIVNEVSAVNFVQDKTNYTFSSEIDGNTYIAVGLMYGTGVTVSFEIKAPYGFVVGSTNIGSDSRSFNPLHYIDSNIVAATIDGNLYKKNMAYLPASNPSDAVIGGYHLEFVNISFVGIPLSTLYDDVKLILDGTGLDIFPAVINEENRIRVGNFATKEEAETLLSQFAGNFSEYEISVAEPSKTCSTIVNPNTDKILFEYDAGIENDKYIGFMAYQGDEHKSYIQTPADNLYDGVMAFKPLHTENTTGIALTNLLELESYVEGVLPYEISNSWSKEVLRTFAVTIRSYACANYLKWYDKYGFDLTCTTSDQVYRGRNRVNDSVVQAVESTKGLVISYGGKICSAYYSSSMGGSTVSSQYVWGSSRGYLVNIATPWERYSEYNNGLWHSEVSPTELCEKLRSKGYTELSGSITSIKGTTTDDGSGYVYSLTFTDSSGHTVTIKRSDTIRTVLSSYLNSANFIFGQGSLDFVYDKVLDIQVSGVDKEEPNPGIPEDTEDDGEYEFIVEGYITNNQTLISEINVLTADSNEILLSEYPVAYVLTSTGRKVIMNSRIATADEFEESSPFVYKHGKLTPTKDIGNTSEESELVLLKTAENTDASSVSKISENPVLVENASSIGNDEYVVSSVFGDIEIKTTIKKIKETITASSSKNFIFAGKGWGHGVGISQYGAKDLSDAGVPAETILAIYFNGISVVPLDSLG